MRCLRQSVCLLLLLLIWMPFGSGIASAETPVPAEESIFVGQVQTLPRANPIHGPQDVDGVIRGATGPVGGVRVRVRWPGGGAETTSAADGSFKFTLTPGQFSLELLDRPSRQLNFAVAPNLQVRVEFVEIGPPATATPVPPTHTPTPMPTSTTITETIDITGTLTVTAMMTVTATETATPTPLPTDTPTPTSTPTPSPTPSRTPTPTRTPALTPVPQIGTPIAVTTSQAVIVRQPTAVPPSQSVLPELMGIRIQPEPWLSSFLFGGGIGAGLVIIYLVIAMLRR